MNKRRYICMHIIHVIIYKCIFIYIYLFILLQAKINMYIIDHYVCVQVGIICEFVYYVPHVRIYICTYGLCTVYMFVNFVISSFLFANSLTWIKKIVMII